MNTSSSSSDSFTPVPSGDCLCLCNNPTYSKYFRLLNAGIQEKLVRRLMISHGKDPCILHLDPNQSLELQLQLSGDGHDEKKREISYDEDISTVASTRMDRLSSLVEKIHKTTTTDDERDTSKNPPMKG